jgi:membrane protein implicated in regulation of membrane protease activity
MRVEKILLIAIAILLIGAVIVPIIILYLIKDRMVTGQIGDTLGGTTAPLINISAILAVVATFTYQRRNDRRNGSREEVLRSFQNLKEELQKIEYVTTSTQGKEKTIKHYIGSEAIREIIRASNNGEYSIDIRELKPFNSILNVYQYLHLLIRDTTEDIYLSSNDKRMLLTQLSLFYRNNLLIEKEQRGDSVCPHHGVRHEIPSEIYEQLIEIENKII